jgi:hypothetical protein
MNACMTALLLVVLAITTASRAEDAPGAENTTEKLGYRIDKPGTITFTTVMKITGKVEKPQVMIFLPKERPFFRQMDFSHSFLSDIMEPLPLAPIVK